MQRIRWSEGMFLRPHHMQYSDLYHEELTKYQASMLNKHFWGVASLDMNMEALHAGLLEFERCELILRSGLVVRHPGNATLERRTFDSLMPGGGRALSAFVAVKRQKSGEPDCPASPDEHADARYRIKQIELLDMNTGTNPCLAEALEVNARLFVSGDEEVLKNYDSIKVAEIVQTGKRDPQFELSKDYIPPCLRISANRVIHSLAKRLMDLLISKAKILSDQIRTRGRSIAGLPAGDIEPLLMLHSINSYLPVVMDHVSEGGIHPFPLYMIFSQLCGSLCTFSKQENAWQMKPYDHENLSSCYGYMAEEISRLLEVSVPSEYEQLSLAFDGDFFCTLLSSSLLEPGSRYFLTVTSSSCSPESLQESLSRKAKITSRENMGHLISQALGGIPLISLQEPPPELPRLPGCAVFRLGEHETQWDSVRRDGNVAVYVELLPGEIKLELFVVKRR